MGLVVLQFCTDVVVPAAQPMSACVQHQLRARAYDSHRCARTVGRDMALERPGCRCGRHDAACREREREQAAQCRPPTARVRSAPRRACVHLHCCHVRGVTTSGAARRQHRLVASTQVQQDDTISRTARSATCGCRSQARAAPSGGWVLSTTKRRETKTVREEEPSKFVQTSHPTVCPGNVAKSGVGER